MNKIVLRGMISAAVAASAMLPAAVVESSDPDTGYKVLTVAAGEFAQYATTLDAPLLTANTLAFAEGKGVRVTEANTLDEATFGAMKTVATFTNPIALPSLTLVNADGTAWTGNRQWSLFLADGGRTLKFGALRGTMLLIK